jgi:hypothetical protein
MADCCDRPVPGIGGGTGSGRSAPSAPLARIGSATVGDIVIISFTSVLLNTTTGWAVADRGNLLDPAMSPSMLRGPCEQPMGWPTGIEEGSVP